MKSTKRTSPTGALFIWESRVLFFGRSIAAEAHSHLNASLLISRDKPFIIQTDKGKRTDLKSVLLHPNVYHSLDATASQMIVIQVDPAGSEYQALKKAADTLDANAIVFEGIVEVRRPALPESVPVDCDAAARFCETVLKAISGYTAPPASQDPRIKQIISMLKDRISEDMPEQLPIDELGAAVSLSADRLMHLFKEEMGMPIRRYSLWLKLRRAVILTQMEGLSMTESAHAAGFSDSAHLSRTFKEMFGLPPSQFFGNDRFIQVNQCEVW